MRILFSMAVVLVVSACGMREREQQNAAYHEWVARVDGAQPVAAASLDGVWERTRIITLYQDAHDSRHDGALESTFADSGEWLLIYQGNIARELLRFGCPFPYTEPRWLVEKGLEGDNARAVGAFLEEVSRSQSDAWAPFTLEGTQLKTDKVLRGTRPRTDNEHAKLEPEPFEISIVSVTPEHLQIAYQMPKASGGGVHTVIEEYTRLNDDARKAQLIKSRDAKACETEKKD